MTPNTTEAVQAYNAALAAFQAKIPRVGKGQTATVKSDKGNYSYDYADLTDITDVALPLLAEQGLAFTARPTLHDGTFVLDYGLVHRDGYGEGGLYPLPDPSRSSPQQIGSAITYGRRYCLCAVTGIAPGGDDDDGQHASDARSQERPAQQTRQAQAPAASADDPAVLRAQIAAVAKDKGFKLDWVATKFESDNGVPIQQGDVEQLQAFLALLQTGEVA